LRSRALATTLCLLLAAPVAAGPSACGSGADRSKAVAPRSTFVGLVSEDVFVGLPRYQDATLARQKQLGVEILRQTFDWSTLEPSRGRFSLATTDRFVLAAARHGIAVLPILFNAPRWATGKTRPAGSNVVDPPRAPASMARFARAMIDRYGPTGSLWRHNPRVAKLPIRDWQVWNEPNLPQYWANNPDARGYAKLLRVVSRAIHASDRGARVLSAGLSESKLGVPFATYVRALYAARARGSFDIFALHPYSSSARGVLAAVEGTRALMRQYGDAHKPIWITEMGWASGGPPSPFTFDPFGQAQLVATSIQLLATKRRALRIAGFVYFGWKDARPYLGRSDFWGLHTGLVTRDDSAKPSLASFRDAVERASG
jgi:Glycosyl hydrolase catalytic core